jgi:hypothetical protein
MRVLALILALVASASAVNLEAVSDHMRSLVNEALSKQGRSLRAGLTADSMVLRDVKTCGSSSDLAKNLVVTVNPADPNPGEEYTTITDYDLEDGVVVSGGKAHYKATLSGFPIVDTTDDLCDDLKSGPTPCPLSGHVHSEAKDKMITGVHGDLQSTMTWTDSNGKQILCLALSFYL